VLLEPHRPLVQYRAMQHISPLLPQLGTQKSPPKSRHCSDPLHRGADIREAFCSLPNPIPRHIAGPVGNVRSSMPMSHALPGHAICPAPPHSHVRVSGQQESPAAHPVFAEVAQHG
jgi:hypothetical protein